MKKSTISIIFTIIVLCACVFCALFSSTAAIFIYLLSSDSSIEGKNPGDVQNTVELGERITLSKLSSLPENLSEESKAELKAGYEEHFDIIFRNDKEEEYLGYFGDEWEIIQINLEYYYDTLTEIFDFKPRRDLHQLEIIFESSTGSSLDEEYELFKQDWEESLIE